MVAATEEGGYIDSDDDDDDSADPPNVSGFTTSHSLRQLTAASKLKSRVFVTKKIMNRNSMANKKNKSLRSGILSTLSFLGTSQLSNKNEKSISELEVVDAEKLEVRVLNNKRIDSKEIRHLSSIDQILAFVTELNTLMKRAHEHQNIDGAFTFLLKVEQKTAGLRLIELKYFKNDDADNGIDEKIKEIYKTIMDTLLLHTSILHKCTTEEAFTRFSEFVGYNVGGRVYCLAELESLQNDKWHTNRDVDTDSSHVLYSTSFDDQIAL